jgi:hypothetical protein
MSPALDFTVMPAVTDEPDTSVPPSAVTKLAPTRLGEGPAENAGQTFHRVCQGRIGVGKCVFTSACA